MKIISVILITALIARNALYLGAISEALRGLSLALCGLTGMLMVMTGNVAQIFRKYWPIFGYIMALLFSTVLSDDYLYIGFQLASLVAIFLFSIALYEQHKNHIGSVNETIFNTIIYLYALACLCSLILVYVDRSIAFEILYGGEVRFRGVFPKSGMMGASAGLLIGLTFFSKKNKIFKYFVLAIGGICIALTLSRTFWVATFVSIFLTTWLYKPKLKPIMMAYSFAVIVMVVGLLVVFPSALNFDSASQITRADSISNLSGRLSLWEEGLSAANKRPILGYGLTAGSAALDEGKSLFSRDELEQSRDRGKRTLHSGYIQALLDGGVIGLIFYLLIIFIGIKNVFKRDALRQHSAAFYSIIFLSISNLSENIIYAASVFNSILFWLLATFSMGLSKSYKPSPEQNN